MILPEKSGPKIETVQDRCGRCNEHATCMYFFIKRTLGACLLMRVQSCIALSLADKPVDKERGSVMGRYLDILNMENHTGWPKRFIRYKTGAFLFEMSQKEFERLAKECHEHFKPCLVKPRQMVLVDAKIFEEYLELFMVR